MHAQGRALRALARSILGRSEEADDVVQDAYAAALAREPAEAPSPNWLRGVVRNLARRRLRDRATRRRYESATEPDANAIPTDEVVATVHMHRELADAVLALADPYRTAIVLRFWHDLPPRAISKRLGMPVATVKTHLQRGLATLEAKFDRRYGDRRSWLLALVPIARPRNWAAFGTGTPIAVTAALLTMNTKHLLAAAGVLICATFGIWAAWPPPDTTATPATDAELPVALDATVGGEPAAEDAAANGDDTAATSTASERSRVADGSPRCKVTGRIVDTLSGGPALGATLRLANFTPFEKYPDRATTADEDGRFELEVPLAASGWIFYRFALASAPERATTEVRIDSDVQQTITDGVLDLGTIELVRGVALSGRVFEHDGRPLDSAAELIVWDPSRIGSSVSMYQGRVLGSTEDDGRIALDERLAPNPRGVLMLTAIAENGIGWTRLGVAPEQEDLPPVEITLQPSGRVAARIVDTQGEPIAGASVTTVPHFLPIGLAPMWPEKWARSATPPLPSIAALFRRSTDSEGRVVFPTLPLPTGQSVRDANRHQGHERNYIVAAHAKGYLRNEATVRPSEDGPSDDETAEVEIVLDVRREVALCGRVTTPDGTPVSGVEVRGNGVDISCVSDDEGRYELESHAHHRAAHLLAEGPNHPRVFVRIPIPDTGDTVEHDIVVERRDPVTGRVVDEDGQPLEGVQVMLGIHKGVHYESEPEQTGPDGRFSFPNAVASHDDLWVTPPAPRTRWAPFTERTVTQRDGLTITLRRVSGDLADLRVEVVDGATGAPAPPGEVELWPLRGSERDFSQPSPRPQIAVGEITAPALREGRYRLVVRATDGRRGEREIEVDADNDKPIRLELWEPASVVCTLDTSHLSADDIASLGTMLVLLRPSHEQSYVVDKNGDPLPFTPNTGMLRLGKTESFRLVRVTPNTPLSLEVAGSDFFGEVRFTAKPRTETRVTMRPVRPGTIRFAPPSGHDEGQMEIAIEDGSGTWRTISTHGRKIRRPPGTVRWRLRFWPNDADEALEHAGTTTVETGATTKVAWPR